MCCQQFTETGGSTRWSSRDGNPVTPDLGESEAVNYSNRARRRDRQISLRTISLAE
jgi:hypothetical protein